MNAGSSAEAGGLVSLVRGTCGETLKVGIEARSLDDADSAEGARLLNAGGADAVFRYQHI